MNGEACDQSSRAAQIPASSGSPSELMPPPITTVSTSTLNTSIRTAEATLARNRWRTPIASGSPAAADSKSACTGKQNGDRRTRNGHVGHGMLPSRW